jgi:hypothetical protein
MCILLLVAAGCRSPNDSPPIRVVDFIKQFDRADQRPPGTFEIAYRGRPSILAPAPGRIAWTLPLPRRGRFHADVAADGAARVRFRVGVSDERISEQLADIVVEPAQGWMSLTVDLSAYAGRKWSLFYRPDAIDWHVTLSTDAVNGVPGRAAWGAPSVLTDRSGAIDYEKRRRRRRP